jgi:hypothetical protein
MGARHALWLIVAKPELAKNQGKAYTVRRRVALLSYPRILGSLLHCTC